MAQVILKSRLAETKKEKQIILINANKIFFFKLIFDLVVVLIEHSVTVKIRVNVGNRNPTIYEQR